MTKVRSAKAKGMLAQKQVLKLLADAAKSHGVTEDMLRSIPSGVPGSDIEFFSKAKSLYPYDVEVKFNKTIGNCAFIKQSEERITKSKEKIEPCAIFRENRGKFYAMITLEHFLELLGEKWKNTAK